MNASKTLKERAILMRLSLGLPGENRQDPGLSDEVKAEHKLGGQAGRWIKSLYPPEALAGVKKLHGEARMYHAAITLPWDNGIGILPAALYYEYGERMREIQGKVEVEVEKFLSQPERWIAWAEVQHNGTFDPDLYPGCKESDPTVAAITGKKYTVDGAAFREAMKPKFAFSTDPIPVPESCHFTQTITSLLGVDVSSVDQRVAESAKEAQRELLARLLKPVQAMATKLGEQPKVDKNGKQKDDIVFRDSLVGNLVEIARIGPALNLSDDPQVAEFIAEVEALSKAKPDTLREDKSERSKRQAQADALARKMAAYSF